MKVRCPRKHQAAQQQIEQPHLPASKPQMTFRPARMATLNHKPFFRYSFDLWSDQLTLWYRCEFLLLFYRRKELRARNPAGWPAASKLFLSLLRHTRWGSIRSAEEHVSAWGIGSSDQSTNRSPRSKCSFNRIWHKYMWFMGRNLFHPLINLGVIFSQPLSYCTWASHRSCTQ